MMLFLLLLITPFVSGDRIVATNSGPVRGFPVEGRKVDAFLGIPYAEPPVGDLRLSKPVPKSPWKETYDAKELPPSCVQLTPPKEVFPLIATNTEMSEDCLFLNLWVPEGGSDAKPVMLYIHGGAFVAGSSNRKLYDGAMLSERGDVIVATINYRVGTLGFFSGFIDEAPGNLGMHDQLMAIQWVKDNAKHFGGDPDNIVLFGESAGSMSVSLHMVSPLSKNLFKRAILQSGSTYHPIFSDDNTILTTGGQIVATMLGCSSEDKSLKKNPKEVVDCMKRLPAEKYAETDLVYAQTYTVLIPRIGDDFLPTNPIDLYRKGDFKDSEVLIGVTRDEGSFFLTSKKPDIFGLHGEKVDAHTFNETSAKELLHSLTGLDDDSGIFQSYLDRVKNEMGYSYLDAMSEVMGDFVMICGAVFQADFQSLKNTPVYFYIFDYRPPSTSLAEWMGVTHIEDIPYVFGNPLHKNFTQNEEEFSNDMMDMWIAFAKTGNPSIPGGLQWPLYTFEDPKYYIISQRDEVRVRPDNYRCEKFRNMFRSVIDDATIKNLKNIIVN